MVRIKDKLREILCSLSSILGMGMWGSQIEWLELQAKQAYHDQDISIDCGSIDCKAQLRYAYQLVLVAWAFLDLFSSSKCNKSAQTVYSLGMVQRKKVSLKSSRKSVILKNWVKAYPWRRPPLLTCLMWQLNLHIYDVFYSKANNDPRMKTDCLITHILILPVRPSPFQILQIVF